MNPIPHTYQSQVDELKKMCDKDLIPGTKRCMI